MKTVEGIVTKIIEAPSKYGKGHLYTVLLCDDGGNEHGVYYNFGTTQPPCAEGDRVRLGVEFQGSKRAKFVEGQGEIVAKGVGVPRGGSTGSSGGGGNAGGSRYNDPKTQQSISYQSSRKDALQLLAIALQHEALPLGQSKAKRYDTLKAYLRKLTAELYLDLQDVDAAVKAADVEPPPETDAGTLPEREQTAENDDEIKLGEAEVEEPKQASGGKF